MYFWPVFAMHYLIQTSPNASHSTYSQSVVDLRLALNWDLNKRHLLQQKYRLHSLAQLSCLTTQSITLPFLKDVAGFEMYLLQ